MFFLYKRINLFFFAIFVFILFSAFVLNVKNNRVYLFNYELPDLSYSSSNKLFPSHGLTRSFIFLMHGEYEKSKSYNNNAKNLLIFIILNLLFCLISFFSKFQFYPLFHFFLFLISYIGILGNVLKLYFLP
jgi:hypothetical protein